MSIEHWSYTRFIMRTVVCNLIFASEIWIYWFDYPLNEQGVQFLCNDVVHKKYFALVVKR